MLAGPVVMVLPIGLAELHESNDALGTSTTSCVFVVKLKTASDNQEINTKLIITKLLR